MGKETEQHQREPAAYIEAEDLRKIAAGAQWGGPVWGRQAKEPFLPRVPVFTHADSGEVERLTEQLEVANQAIAYAARQAEEKQKVADALMADAKQFRAERDTLRAQLAELEALHGGELGLPKEGWPAYHKRKMESLRDLTAGHYERKLAERDALLREVIESSSANNKIYGKHLAALSASAEPSEREKQALQDEKRLGIERLPAEPSAPVEIDERAAFEAWFRGTGLAQAWGGAEETPDKYLTRYGAGGEYYSGCCVQSRWEGWQARAALERKS